MRAWVLAVTLALACRPGGTRPAPADPPTRAGLQEARSPAGEALTRAFPGEHVRFVGRHDDTEPGRVRYGWPGTGLVVRFDGTAVHARLDDAAGFHGVEIDGGLAGVLETRPGARRYTLAEGLTPGEHTVRLLRRTEGHLGITTVHEVEVEGRPLPPPPPRPRLEVLGDSITAGYGTEGPDARCTFTPATENHLGSYAALAAREVGLELSAIAWSGKGVLHNYGDDVVEPLPAVYERALPTEAEPRWDFRDPARVVLINLGTNDFSTDDDPSRRRFVAAYVELLAMVRRAHPRARVLCTVAPLLPEAERRRVEGYIDEAIARRRAAGDEGLERIELHVDPIGWGCDWHPSAATHAAMAERLVPALRRALKGE